MLRLAPFALMIASCANTSAGLSEQALDGSWRIVSVSGAPANGTMQLQEGSMRVSFGCNSGSGAFRINSGTLVPSGGMAVTEMACMPAQEGGPDLMALESRGFAVMAQPMWIAEDRQPRRVRLWNDRGWIAADWQGAPR
jgi:heat shock protein HslJ